MKHTADTVNNKKDVPMYSYPRYGGGASILHQKNIVHAGRGFQWDTELRAVLQWNMEELRVAEGRMCGHLGQSRPIRDS